MLNRVFLALARYGFGAQRVIPSLDGLRAISISLVLLGHLSGTHGFPWTLQGSPLASFGVRVFFVISAYLITSLLLGEIGKTGTIALKRFYFRRTLRLFPACYFYIGSIALLAWFEWVSVQKIDFALAITYTMNFYEERGWQLGHLWSLAVEEQFYLLWPFTLRMLGPARSTRLLLYVLAAAPLLRLMSPFTGPAVNFFVWSDALGTGCLLALLREDLERNAHYQRMLSSPWFALIPAVAVLTAYTPSTKLLWMVGETVMNVLIAISVHWSILNAQSPVGKLLNLPAMSFVGVLSYSLYLWQQLFLNRYSSSWYAAFPQNLLLSFAFAVGSYLLIESPFLRLRMALERSRKRSGAAVAVGRG